MILSNRRHRYRQGGLRDDAIPPLYLANRWGEGGEMGCVLSPSVSSISHIRTVSPAGSLPFMVL